MEDIEIEEYVRTRSGRIYKVENCKIEDNKVITYAGGEYRVVDLILKYGK